MHREICGILPTHTHTQVLYVAVENDGAVGNTGEWESHTYQYTLMHGTMSQCEQRASIRVCIKLGKTGGETGWMIQDVYQEECLSQPHIYKWYQWFKAGREEDNREGSPVTVQSDDAVVHAREIVCTDSTNGLCCCWKGRCLIWNLQQHTPWWFEHALSVWSHSSKTSHWTSAEWKSCNR